MCTTHFKQGTCFFEKNQATTQMSPLQETVPGKACCHMFTPQLQFHSDPVHVSICSFVLLMLTIYITACAAINQHSYALFSFSFPEVPAGAHADTRARMVFQLHWQWQREKGCFLILKEGYNRYFSTALPGCCYSAEEKGGKKMGMNIQHAG